MHSKVNGRLGTICLRVKTSAMHTMRSNMFTIIKTVMSPEVEIEVCILLHNK